MRFDAAILDVDGVLTRTAVLHERAWKEMFDRVLAEHGDGRPFTHEDYRAHVDGKPRMDGLRDFLRARGIELAAAELEGLAAEKDRGFQQLLRGGVARYDDAVQAVRTWRAHGMAVGFVSASRNARYVLEAAGIDHLAHVRVDGEIAAREGLAGKTAMFREAARRLGVDPARALVVEDAVSGVAAASEAGFGLVVGVVRDGAGEGAALAEHGAGQVVRRLDDLEGVVEAGARSAAELPSALRFERVEARLAGREPVVLLDFDGTLAPIVPLPDDAAMPEEVRRVVARLGELCRVAIVSGRDREDVARRVGLPGLWYVGSHGLDGMSPDGHRFVCEEARPALPALERARELLERDLHGLPGIVIEPKAFALAIHYRTASEADTRRAIRLVQEIGRREPHLRTHSDLAVIELRPDVDWDKGRAIEYVLGVLDLRSTEAVPLFVGDGHTDEDGFRVLRGRGIGVLVGAPLRPTHAGMRLDRQEDVGPFLERLVRWMEAETERRAWVFRYDGWDPEREALREALCTLGNGNLATRGAAEESAADDIHYPGTYLAGGYDRIATEIRGEVVVSEDLVNWPNWLRLSFRPEGGDWLSTSSHEVLQLSQELDMRQGLLRRWLRVRDRAGRETTLVSRRIVSMDDPAVAALDWELTPENWSGPIEIRSSLDGTVSNSGVARYRKLRGDHLVPDGLGRVDHETVWLGVRARQSGIRMAQVARTRVCAAGEPLRPRHEVEEQVDRIDHVIQVEVSCGRPIGVEKVVVMKSSLEAAISAPADDARDRIAHLAGFDDLAAAHQRRWAQLWHRCDIRMGPGREEENRILRLHVFHLLQVVSPHIVNRGVGVPARGLHGEAYRGHVFWDELFIFPFFNFRIPELTRELLMYRYLRLPAARDLARELGYRGAAYPWQSGSSGREESQRLHLNPRSGRWLPDETLLQHHIGAAVAWNTWQYFITTCDREFLSFHGAEMLIEIARFWASIARWDEVAGRHRIRGVVGPDEFHTRLPGADRPGLDDNAYTTVMAAWCLRCVERALAELDDDRRAELVAQLGVTDEERRGWREIASTLRLVFLPGGRIISQFDGYEQLEELDWDGLRARHGDIQRLDRILEAEGDSPNRYKASKQADVLMLFFLFNGDELATMLRSMGYEFEPSWIRENVDYYLRRTSHGSTLSRVLHSWVLSRDDRPHSWRLFCEALRSDVADVQGGTTAEGIHLGAMAGTVDLAQRGYTGAVVRGGVLWFEPRLPDPLPSLEMRLRFRGAWLEVRLTRTRLEVNHSSGDAESVRIGVAGQVHELARGQRRAFELEPVT